MSAPKPFAPACERNQEPILKVLQSIFTKPATVLEIGSGTGQHAAYFAGKLPNIIWQCSDVADNLPGIRAWLADTNLPAPLELNVSQAAWPVESVGGVFTANSSHIMSWECVEKMFAGVASCLESGGHFCLYGPFKQNGDFTSDSNVQFEAWLKQQGPHMGQRDLEALLELAAQNHMSLQQTIAMPANNFILDFVRA